MEISVSLIVSFIIFYFICAACIHSFIVDVLAHRETFSYRRHNIVSVKLDSFIENNRKRIEQYGAFLFPLTICMMISIFFSSQIYREILTKSDEDRIIPWLF